MKKFVLTFLIGISSIVFMQGREIIEIEPLFEYPSAPEELDGLEERCNYIVKNFWNNFNFKNKKTVDQYALNEAFSVYASAFRYASIKEADQSIDKLLKQLNGNPALLIQFCNAAEENLYGPRAEYWIDDVYIKFLNAVIKNKKIPENKKKRYIGQLSSLTQSKVGNRAPLFEFINASGDTKKYFPMSTPTLLIFGDPDNTDWRMERLKIDTNLKLNEALDKGKLNIIYIIPGKKENWPNLVSNYNSKWIIGQSDNIKSVYDIRNNPSYYIISGTGEIIEKNLPPEQIVTTLLNQLN